MKEDKAYMFDYYWGIVTADDDVEPPVREYRFGAMASGGVGKGLRERLKKTGLQDWRFDRAWPEKKVAVEIDGNAWHTKGGGRHSQDEDRKKLNAARVLGWIVFQFSPKMLSDDPDGCIEQVLCVLEK